MELFAKIVNGFHALILDLSSPSSILNRFLDPDILIFQSKKFKGFCFRFLFDASRRF